jgi:outer membrane protein assembly factor BamB
MRRISTLGGLAAIALAAGAAQAVDVDTGQLLYSTEGNRLRRIDVDTVSHPPLRQDVLIRNATEGEFGSAGADGRDVNGMVCRLPDGNLVMGEDTGQTAVKPGFGVFTPAGEQVGKLTPTSFVAQAEPFGCGVDAEGRLFTTEIGNQAFGPLNGQLILWFPPYEVFPGAPGTYPNGATSANYCKLAIEIGTATGVAIDPEGRVLVASPRQGQVFRFSGTWPTGPDAAGGCGRTDSTGAPLVDEGRIEVETFIQDPSIFTPSGIARAENGNWFVSSVLFGKIAEFTPAGAFVRTILDPGTVLQLPAPTGHPQSLAFDAQGTLYYADLDLRGSLLNPDTGPNGTIRRIRFDEDGDPLPPDFVRQGLAFPDGVAVLPGDLEPTEWRTLGGSPERKYFNPDEHTMTSENVDQLATRWIYPTQAIVTGSPTVATLDVPGEGRVPVVLFQTWDERLHAVRLADGSVLWQFLADFHPGASYPASGSVHVETVDGTDRVLYGAGEKLYALDAVTGAEIWHFTAGTGCVDELGNPPGLCSFQAERNQIESTPAVVGDTVVFGMDVNDFPSGKGGLYGVDVRTGHMKWFFDLESGSTCRPDPGDEIERYDGYHDEAELGLPEGFLASRAGCDHPRTRSGCGNVWSSPAVDFGRQRIFIASSNCDTDDDPGTSVPPPPMPPYDEAIFALDFAGNPVWRWRPREVDNDDLAFGAVPNLFRISDGDPDGEGPQEEEFIDVLGVGCKDGTYYVVDRDGENERTQVAWDDADPSALPYWTKNVVPGGAIGGIIASASVDEGARLVLFSTGPGDSQPDVFDPQRPTMHALHLDTGEIAWQGPTVVSPTDTFVYDASYAPTTGIPGVAFTGGVLSPSLHAWDTAAGELAWWGFIGSPIFSNAVTSGATTVDGTVIVGTGIGTRTGDPHDIEDQISREPRALVALCVPGTRGCGECDDGTDNDDDGLVDTADDGCDDAADASEKSPHLVCDNGQDDDGDGIVDADDPGCPVPYATIEDPQCDNGLDDDGNGAVDWFDDKCTRGWPYWEATPCGLGVELALVVPLLAAWRRRSGRRGPGSSA